MFDRGYPSFGNVDSAIPIDVVGMKTYVDSLFDPTSVPVGVTINKLNLAPNRNTPLFVSVLRNRRGLSTSKPYASVMFFFPFSHWSPSFTDIRVYKLKHFYELAELIELIIKALKVTNLICKLNQRPVVHQLNSLFVWSSWIASNISAWQCIQRYKLFTSCTNLWGLYTTGKVSKTAHKSLQSPVRDFPDAPGRTMSNSCAVV